MEVVEVEHTWKKVFVVADFEGFWDIPFQIELRTSTIIWSAAVFFVLLARRRPNKYFLREVNLGFNMYIFSLICQSVYLLWKIAVQNIGCVSACFGGGNKNNLRSLFRSLTLFLTWKESFKFVIRWVLE